MANVPAITDTSDGCPKACRIVEVFHKIRELETRKKEITTRPVRE
jgi:hypothetical protein